MKKLIALLLAGLLLPGLALAQGLTEDQLISLQSPVKVEEDTIGLQEGTEITIGTRTAMSGYFATDLWSSNTVDVDVRSLLHAYSTVTWIESDGLLFDSMVVAGTQMMTSENGNRVYVISLMTDLMYNDGTPITARDYVFSLLLSTSPIVSELGGTPRDLYALAGFDAYASGEVRGIAGLRLLSEDTFSMEISADYLPYFYGLALLEATPYPMHIIAPGCTIVDDEGGAYIAGGEEGDFSAEMLQRTLMDPDEGYMFHPYVTSGPYQLEAHDREARKASFVINPNYMGNYQGIKPHIERIVVREVAAETALEELQSGAVDIINKVTDGDIATPGLALAARPDSGIASEDYMRSGYAFLSLACELAPTDSAAVRRAIAHCIDKQAFVASVSPYAEIVNGYYGMGQWMTSYEDVADEALGISEGVSVADFLPTLAVGYDLDAAKALLIEDGWVYDEKGEPYVEGSGEMRYGMRDGELIPLLIKAGKTENNAVADNLEILITNPLREVGIGVEMTVMRFEALLAQHYRTTERTHNAFFLGSNFMHTFDPYIDFNTADEFQGLGNQSGLRDETLMALALEMRQTEASNLHEYIVEWMTFQERFVALMPMVPLYSNRYFDFYSDRIENYNIAQSKSWAYEIPLAWIAEE